MYRTVHGEEDKKKMPNPADEEQFLKDYRRIMDAIYHSKTLHGYCYTQLSDVYQETNGLVYENRSTKLSPEEVRFIVCGGNKWGVLLPCKGCKC